MIVSPKKPIKLELVQKAAEDLNFDMNCAIETGSLLQSLVASKVPGRILELGTGTGAGLCWMLEGLSADGVILSIDNDDLVQEIARKFLEEDDRCEFLTGDAGDYLLNYEGDQFDLIFADAFPGKFSHFEETISILKKGGFYIVDDLLPQENWSNLENHAQRVKEYIQMLEQRTDLALCSMNWSTGIMVATKL